MFFTEIRHKPRWLSKSWIITLISIIQNLWNSMLILIIPLYLYKIFKSELILWEVSSFAAMAWIVSTILMWFILAKFQRHHIFKAMTVIWIIWIVLLIFTKTVFDVNIARMLARSVNVILPAILALYLKDLTSPEDYPHTQWVYSALINLSWLLWPMISWSLIEYFSHIKSNFLNISIINNFDFEYLEYTITFFIIVVLFLISLIIFIWWKFIIKHKHLQKNIKTAESNSAHHVIHIVNFAEYFKDKNRSLAFINLSFIAIWWVLVYTFMPILFEKHWMQTWVIWIVIWLISLPLVLLEWFLSKYLKIFWWNINTLFAWYLIFAIFVIFAFIVWYDNIYIFAWLIITSSIWVAITEPLQELMYFEWTDKSNENTYYSIFWLWNSLFTLLTPALSWILISKLWIDKFLSLIPIIFLIMIWILSYYKFLKKD